MRAADAREFMNRDWAAVAEAKEAAWLELRRTEGAGGCVRVAHELRARARLVNPSWPSDADRAEDIATHQRVGEALRRAGAVERH